jgi:hypothetical protein
MIPPPINNVWREVVWPHRNEFPLDVADEPHVEEGVHQRTTSINLSTFLPQLLIQITEEQLPAHPNCDGGHASPHVELNGCEQRDRREALRTLAYRLGFRSLPARREKTSCCAATAESLALTALRLAIRDWQGMTIAFHLASGVTASPFHRQICRPHQRAT